MTAQLLDALTAVRWGRLREGVRRCELRRGGWYPILSLGQNEAILVVRRRAVSIPLTYLEVTHTRPERWTVLSRERYAVCPNCAARVAIGKPPEEMRCRKCQGVFEVESDQPALATAQL